MSDAEATLRDLLQQITRQLNYRPDVTIHALTSGGANFTSTLFTATVSSSDNEHIKLFAKVANISEKYRAVMKIDIMFKKENFFYTDLEEVYKKLEEKHNVPSEHRFVFPKFYGSNPKEGQETIVLEDLVANGYQPYSRFKSIDWEHMATAVEALAKLHAFSFAYKKEDPENFEKALKKLPLVVSERNEDPNMKEAWEKMVASAVQVVRDEHKGKLVKFLTAESIPEDFFKYMMPLNAPVISHGDYRVSNMLFRRRHNKLESIVVDYQTLHAGSPAIDILYLELLGTDEQFRRENHQRLLEYYYDQLSLALGRLHVDVTEVFPREVFDAEVKEMLPHALRISAFLLPIVLVEADRAPTFGGDSKVQDFALTPTELFAERFSGVVSDCVRWGVL